jgi:DNA-binding NtrC family response regulator
MAHDHRVLIVEDDYAFRWSLAVRFQRRGVDTDVAENVREARDLIARDGDYCCVLLDLKLPPTGGEEVLAAIEKAHDPKPPVLVITAYPDAWERGAGSGHATQVRRAVMKPVEVDAVVTEALSHCALASAF